MSKSGPGCGGRRFI